MRRSRSRTACAALFALPLAFAPPAAAQWSGDPAVNAPVVAAPGRQDAPAMAADALGRTTWVWQDARTGAGDLFAQRLDARGVQLWGAGGAAVCTDAGAQAAPQVALSGGVAIVAWTDARADSGDVFAQALDAAGFPVWAADGVAACDAAGRQFAPAIAADDSGGAIVAWVDRRDGVNALVFAQRLDPSGARRWDAAGVPVCAAAGAHATPALVPDGAGGAFVVWADGRGGWRANRVDREGVLLWPADGVPVCVAGAPRNLRAVADGAGGFLAAWDRADGTGFFRDIVAQRVTGAGALAWPDTGVVVCRAKLFQRFPVIAPDGAGGAIVAWEDNRDFHLGQVVAQRVDAAGAALWAVDGVSLCALSTARPYPAIVPDGEGGAVVAWQDNRNENLDVYAQRVDPDGAPRWAVNGVAVSTAADTQSVILLAADGAGGVFAGWTDARDPLGATDVNAAHLLGDGTLDAGTTAVGGGAGARGGSLALASANPLRGTAAFAWTLARAGRARLAVHDVRGALVRTIEAGARPAGVHRAEWDLRDDAGRPVASGVYWVSLEADGVRARVRCVALR